MGVLANLRFALQRNRKQGTRPCGHLDQIRDVTPSSTGCQPCLELRDTWVHLRMCMTDGQVLCCDSSKNKHASGHVHQLAPDPPDRPLDGAGLWCYTDQTLVQPPAGGPAR
jgi:CPA2 family monovalent cation:H+ antiporter-2